MSTVTNEKFQHLASINMLETDLHKSVKAFAKGSNNNQPQSDSDLKLVADQFEAIFIEMLLKQARESKLSDGLFDTSSDDNFVQMYDQELAKSSSEMVDIGIAEAIIEQMSAHGLKR